jgi:hypothetical protein
MRRGPLWCVKVVGRPSLQLVGSLLSNGGTSFPTASHRVCGLTLNEGEICRNVVYFLQLVGGELKMTGPENAQESGSLIATLPPIVFGTPVAL